MQLSADSGIKRLPIYITGSFFSLLINISLATVVTFMGKSAGMGEVLKYYFLAFFGGVLLFSGVALLLGFVFALYPYGGWTYKNRLIRAFFISFITVTSLLSIYYLIFCFNQ